MIDSSEKISKGLSVKLALAESFVELVEARSVDEVTVNMIVEGLGKHRKTFYYHFSSKQQLIEWLFRYELAQELEHAFKPDQLIYEGPDGSFPALPYYARNIGELQRIYNAPFFDGLYRCFERRRSYYRRVFSRLGPDTLEHYMLNLYRPAIADDIRYLIERKTAEQNLLLHGDVHEKIDRGYSVDFLAEFYTGAFVSRYIQRLNYSSAGRTVEEISPFEDVIHDSLGWIIHQEVTKAVDALRA